LGDNVKIYPNCFIGDNVVIGDNALLFAGAKIYSDIIGNNCTIHSGAIIGSDGLVLHQILMERTPKYLKLGM
jgi:UDP-3-O-[3-hydroxymyristoyl] glucosamine N-acyltransferase